MTRWSLNYDSGEYEHIDRDGFSYDRGEFVYNWDDSEYRREEELRRQQDGFFHNDNKDDGLL